MKKPILIINVPNWSGTPDETDEQQKKYTDVLKANAAFEDFEIIMFWGAEATIYYPPKEYQE